MTCRWLLMMLGLALAGCLPPAVPLAGKACDDTHGCGLDLVCCQGRCQPSCGRCPERACRLERAVRCEGVEQVCLDGCWEPCPSCAARCSDPSATRCRLDDGETWLCRADEVCVVRQAVGLRADCHVPPPWCAGSDDCACLNSSFALYPACDPWERCVDGDDGLVTCRSVVVDGGSGADASSHDGSGPADAGVMDSAMLDSGTVAADAASASDTSMPDSSPALDAHSGLDAVPGDASAAEDAAIQDAAIQDAAIQDAASGDSAPVVDAGGVPDAAVAADSGTVDAAGPCGPLAPDCFAPRASGPSGERCCQLDAVAASCDGAHWQCPTGFELAARCEGFGEPCSTGTSTSCDQDATCVWAWNDGQGDLQCASFGPASPCVDGAWRCVAGTSAPAACP